MKILITGFDPFGGEKINPAYEAVKLCSSPKGCELIKLQVPTVFNKSLQVVKAAMEKELPDAVILVGQAGGRTFITPERIALNLMDAKAPDNEGNCPVDLPVIPGGENALFSSLPVKKITEAINKINVPAQLSNTAGTFVCNSLMYGVLNFCKEHYPRTLAGFIHVPYLPQQVENKENMPSLPLEDIVKALNEAIKITAQSLS